MQISLIKHDVLTNTIEVTWVEITDEAIENVRCHSYCKEQKDEFATDVGALAAAHIKAAGW